MSAGQRRAQVAVTHPLMLCRFNSCPTHSKNGLVAQLAEQDSLKVEVQGSTPCGATGRWMGVSPNGKTVGLHPANEGSTPSTVHCSCPGGERDIMAPSEGAGPGSTPGRGTDSCPRSVPAARDRAKVDGEVRLLTGILATRPTDGGYGVVAACDPVTVAVPDRNRLSTPARQRQSSSTGRAPLL